MSRQLKFRVWDKLWKKFIVGDLFFEQINYEGFEAAAYEDDDGNLHELKYSQRKLDRYHGYVIQQWTGLKDKNGVDIYEGDILERIGDGLFCKIVVYWDSHNCAFFIKNSFNLHGIGSPISSHYINISDWTYWVICGNIFENSELLES
jgi:hypothetical protein